MNTNTKNTIYILTTVLVVVLGFIIYFKINLNKDIQYIIETKNNNAIALEKIKSITGLKSKLESAKKVSESFDILYVDRNNILSFIEKIEQISEKSETVLVIDNVSIDESTLKNNLPYATLNMLLKVSGSYQETKDFLISLEKLPYFVTINNVRLTKVGSDTNEWVANISISTLTN